MITHYWELDIWIGILILATVLLALDIARVWYRDHTKWKRVKPHYGSTYDATREYKPNVDLRRTR